MKAQTNKEEVAKTPRLIPISSSIGRPLTQSLEKNFYPGTVIKKTLGGSNTEAKDIKSCDECD
jgi:hypothetical protein